MWVCARASPEHNLLTIKNRRFVAAVLLVRLLFFFCFIFG